MTTTVLETGAVFKLVDEFSGPGRRLMEMLGGAQKEVTELQAKLDKLTIAPFVTRAARSFEQFEKMAAGAFGSLDTEAKAGVDAALGAFGKLGTGAAAELDKVKLASAGTWTAVSDGAKVSTDAAIASLGRLNAAAEASAVKMRGVAAISSGGGAGASLAHRASSGPHGGMHLRGHGMSIPGGHVGFSGDGTGQAVGAFAGYELLKGATERGMEMDKIASQYLSSGFNKDQIEEAKRAAWANTRLNPNASAIEGFGDILELNKATGSLSESMETLPAMGRLDTLLKSLKGRGLKGEYNREGQILNFAKGLEELGVTQMGANPEERRGSIEKYTTEFMRTMISSRGLFDGNALFAMTNNSGGASANWDMRMATVVAPILGDIMKHSKLGNADYMALKSYAGGGITSKSVEALMKYGLTEEGDTWSDSKGQWHLKANSKFAEGITENVFDWSGRMRQRLADHGIDINSQKGVNAVVNEIGSNKSTTMLMRALLEPLTRGQIVKEMALRDKVPEDPSGILQKTDPSLKIDAFKKSLENLETALGSGGIVDQATAGLNKLTAGLTALGQFLEGHPRIAGFGTDMTLVATGVLGLSAAVKLLGINVGGARAATAAAAATGGGAGALGFLPQMMALAAAVSAAQQNDVLSVPKRSGWQGFVEGLDAGLADRWFGTQGGAPGASSSGLPSGFHLNAYRTDTFGGEGNSLEDTIYRGTLRAFTDFANGGKLGGVGDVTGGSGFTNAAYTTWAPGGAVDRAARARGASTGLNPYAGGTGAGDFVPPVGDHLTAGMRNNNLGNIGFFGQHMAGLIGPSNARDVDHSIARFDTQESGIRAAASLALHKYLGGRHDAWDLIAGKGGWTPGALGPGASVNVARAMGLSNHDDLHLDRPDQMVKFLHGLAVQEHGPAGRFYSEDRIRGALEHRSMPTVTGPSRKTVSPGSPGMSAMNMPDVVINHQTVLDGKVIDKRTIKHLAQAGRFPTSGGGPDMHSHYSNAAGTPITDAA